MFRRVSQTAVSIPGPMLLPGWSVWVYATMQNPCCSLISHYEYMPLPCHHLFVAIACKHDVIHKTSYVPELRKISQCHQRKTEPQPYETRSSKTMLTDRQTHTLITILCFPTGGWIFTILKTRWATKLETGRTYRFALGIAKMCCQTLNKVRWASFWPRLRLCTRRRVSSGQRLPLTNWKIHTQNLLSITHSMYIYLCINSRRPGEPGLACQLLVGFPHPSVPEQNFSGKVKLVFVIGWMSFPLLNKQC